MTLKDAWETEAQKVNASTHQYFDHSFSVKLSCSSLTRGAKIVAGTGRRSPQTPGVALPSSVAPCSSPGSDFLPCAEAQHPRKAFCQAEAFSAAHSHSLLGWPSSIREYILASPPSRFFSGQTPRLLECFYIITAELLWWHTTSVGLCFYILLQSAIKWDGGLLRCTFWVLAYHTGKCQPILQRTSQIQKWRLQYKLVFQWVGQ